MVQEQRLQLKMKFLLGENCCLVGGAPIFIFCLKTILKVLESKPLRYCEILFSCNKSLTFRNLIDRILELCIIFHDQKFEPPSHFPSQLFLNGEGIYILWEGKKRRVIIFKYYFVKIGIHSMQGSSHYETWNYKKKKQKSLKHTGYLFRKALQLKNVC